MCRRVVGQDIGYTIQTFIGWQGSALAQSPPAIIAPQMHLHVQQGAPTPTFAASAQQQQPVPTGAPSVGNVSAGTSASLNVLYGTQLSAKIAGATQSGQAHAQPQPPAPVVAGMALTVSCAKF